MSPGGGPRGLAVRNRRKRRGAISQNVLKQSYVRQIKRTNHPSVRVGRSFLHTSVNKDREVVLPLSGAPERPEPKKCSGQGALTGAYAK